MEPKKSKRKPQQVDLEQDIPGIEDDLLRFESKACTFVDWFASHIAVLCHLAVTFLTFGLSGGVFNDAVSQKIIYSVTVINGIALTIGYTRTVINKVLQENIKKRRKLILEAKVNA